jgi:apolipoprotein N-acyltransferase
VAVLFLVLQGRGPWRSYLLTLVFGLVMFAPLMWFAAVAADTVAWIALTGACAAIFALVGPAWAYAQRLTNWAWPKLTGRAVPAWLSAIVFALVVTGGDTFRAVWPFGGFPWARLAFSQGEGLMVRWAWLGGAPLVTVTVALTGAILGGLVNSWQRHRTPGEGTRRWLRLPRRLWGSWAVGAAAVAMLALVGPAVLPISGAAQAGDLRVLAVQGNVTVTDEGLFAFRREILNNHVERTLEALEAEPGAELIIWPENSSDVDPLKDPAAREAINEVALAAGVPIVVGAQEYLDNNTRYNWGLWWEPGIGPTARYAKRHPAPFAEFIPARGFFDGLYSKVELIPTDMLPGSGPNLFTLKRAEAGRSVVVGDMICFDVSFDDVGLEAVRGGAELLMVQTNNASFGFSSLSAQQLAMSRLRAIEFGRSTVQISTVGISGMILPNGEVIEQTEAFVPAELLATLPLRTSLTPAVYLGRPIELAGLWIWVVLAAGGLVVSVAARWQRRRSRVADAAEGPSEASS